MVGTQLGDQLGGQLKVASGVQLVCRLSVFANMCSVASVLRLCWLRVAQMAPPVLLVAASVLRTGWGLAAAEMLVGLPSVGWHYLMLGLHLADLLCITIHQSNHNVAAASNM